MISPPRCSLWTSVFEACSQRLHKKGLAPAGADTELMALTKVQKMGPKRQETRQSGVILRVAQTLLTCGSQSVPVPSCCFFAQTCHWKYPKGFFVLSSSANGPSLPSSTLCTSPFQILGNHLLCSLKLVSSWTSWIVTLNSGPWSPLKIFFNCYFIIHVFFSFLRSTYLRKNMLIIKQCTKANSFLFAHSSPFPLLWETTLSRTDVYTRSVSLCLSQFSPRVGSYCPILQLFLLLWH